MVSNDRSPPPSRPPNPIQKPYRPPRLQLNGWSHTRNAFVGASTERTCASSAVPTPRSTCAATNTCLHVHLSCSISPLASSHLEQHRSRGRRSRKAYALQSTTSQPRRAALPAQHQPPSHKQATRGSAAPCVRRMCIRARMYVDASDPGPEGQRVESGAALFSVEEAELPPTHVQNRRVSLWRLELSVNIRVAAPKH